MKHDGNISPDENIIIKEVSRAEQMRLYDSLPLRWRQLVDDLPVPQDLREVVAVREMFGDEVGYGLVLETYREQFPRWTPSGASGACEASGPS